MIFVFDDVLADPVRYREVVLSRETTTREVWEAIFPGILPAIDEEILRVIRTRFPDARPRVSFVSRRAEQGSVGSTPAVGNWAAILFLDRPSECTVFWKELATGRVRGTVDPADGAATSRFAEWFRVEPRSNRLLVFPADLFRSAVMSQDQDGRDSASVHIFGQGELRVTSANARALVMGLCEVAATIH